MKPAIFGNLAELCTSKFAAGLAHRADRFTHRELPRSVIYMADGGGTLALRYVLITSRPNHWDGVGNVSSYPYWMLRGAVMNPERLADHTPAVFVKVDREMRTPRSRGRARWSR